jgi:hypothetical protein
MLTKAKQMPDLAIHPYLKGAKNKIGNVLVITTGKSNAFFGF